jgi:hypothetical protein
MKTLPIALLGCLLLSGCIAAPVVPPLGVIYTDYDAPLDLVPRGNPGAKTGEAHVTSILGLVSWGDGSVRAAANNGGIKDVKLVDYHFKSVVFGVYQRYTTVAHGD